MGNNKKKKCLVFETLGRLNDLQMNEAKDGQGKGMRLTGVFGVAGVKNQNQRIYDKSNYASMVEGLQKVIAEEGCPGELEHPNSFNINLNNVSHKIESIQMNEDGTVTGTILLLNTTKGREAQAIIEGGLPLYISSRGAGTITNEGRVTLTSLKTYDLVGTPGFSQAKMHLDEHQTLECLNEGLGQDAAWNGQSQTWVVINEDADADADNDDDTDDTDTAPAKKPAKKASKKDADADADADTDDDGKHTDDPDDDNPEGGTDNAKPAEGEGDGDGDDDDEKSKGNKKSTSMADIKKSIDELTDKVNSLEASLHVTQESMKPVNYAGIEKWITEEFAPEFRSKIFEQMNDDMTERTRSIAEGVQNWAIHEFAPEVQNWVCEEFAPEVQNWVVEEFAPEVQNWIVEEYSPEVQNWITEEYSPEIQNWIVEEYSPEVQNWITEEYSPVLDKWVMEEFGKNIENKINENVSAYLTESKAGRLSEIDNLLESLSETDSHETLNKIVNEAAMASRFQGYVCVDQMPAQYRPLFEGLTNEQQDEVIRTSRAYDFTKPGVCEKFWAGVNFQGIKDAADDIRLNEGKQVTPQSQYHNSIMESMMHLRQH